MKKSVLGVFMTVVLLLTTVFSVVATTVSAANEDGQTSEHVVYTVQTVESSGVKKGETFTVDVMTNAVDNIGMVEFYFAYDNTKVKAVDKEIKGYLAEMDMKDVVIAPKGDKDKNPATGEVWITGMILEQKTSAENEVIATVTFEALADLTSDVPMFAVGDALAATHEIVDHTTATVDGGLKISVNWGSENTDGQTPENVVYTIETVEVDALKKGDTVQVNVSTNGIHNIAGVEFAFAYDKTKLTPVSSEIKGYLAEMDMKDVVIAPKGDKDKNPANGEIWITGMTMDQLSSADGEVIATVTFEALVDLDASVPMVAVGDTWAATHEIVDHNATSVDGGVKLAGTDLNPTTTTTITTTTTTVPVTLPTVTDPTTKPTTSTTEGAEVSGPSSVVEQDGIVVVMTSDKATYTEGEDITVSVKVTNNKDVTIYGVDIQAFIPEGYFLADGYAQRLKATEVKSGETVELQVVFTVDAGTLGDDTTTTTTEKTLATVTTTSTTKKSTSPQTGEGSLTVTLLILGLSAAAVAGAVALKNRKYRQMLSLVLVCALTLSAVSVVVPMTNVSAAEGIDPIEANLGVTIADKDVSLRAAVSYSLTPPAATMVVYGDSITSSATWPLEVAKNTNMYLFNGALQALNTERALASFQTYVADRNPDFVVFNFGHIDMQRKKSGNNYVSIEDYKANLKKMCEDTVALGATPILLTPNTMDEVLWRGSFMQNKKDYADDGGAAAVLNMYCDAVRALGTEYGYDVVDVHAEMSKYAPEEVLEVDGVFPNAKGNEITATLLSDYINTKYPQSADAEKLTYNRVHVASPAEGGKLDLMSYDAADWEKEKEETINVTNDADGNLVFSNNDGLWPYAYTTPIEPVYVPVEGTEIVVDVSPAAGVNTSIVLFFNGSTPNGVSETMTMPINEFLGYNTDAGSGDLIGGQNIKASIKLSDLVWESPADDAYVGNWNATNAVDEKGNLLISGVKIYAAGAAGAEVVIRELAVQTTGAPNA